MVCLEGVGALHDLRAVALASLLAVSCAPRAPQTPEEPGECQTILPRDPNALHTLYPERMHPDVETHLLLRGRGGAPDAGRRYALIDARGYVGLLVTTGKDLRPEECNDCGPGFWADTRWIDGPKRMPLLDGDAIALGPANGPLPRATLWWRSFTEGRPFSTWVTGMSVDMDGDGRPDFEHRWRDCGCEQASETRTRHGETWVVEERDVHGAVSRHCSEQDDPK